jgi:hypothetical protein
MHCREAVMPILVEKRMKHWAAVIRFPFIDPKCGVVRARRNLIRLVERHGEIARKIGINIARVYSL